MGFPNAFEHKDQRKICLSPDPGQTFIIDQAKKLGSEALVRSEASS